LFRWDTESPSRTGITPETRTRRAGKARYPEKTIQEFQRLVRRGRELRIADGIAAISTQRRDGKSNNGVTFAEGQSHNFRIPKMFNF
jgi:hypothetical protein